MVVLAEPLCVKGSPVDSSDPEGAALQQQALDDLLKSKDLQSLLVLLLALYARQLHKLHGGRLAVASHATPALSDASSSSSRTSSSSQQRRQRQQQQEQQQLLVPALHEQLLQQFGISEQSIAGSLLDSVVAQSAFPAHKGLFATVRVLQMLLDGSPLPKRETQQSSTSGSAGLGNSSSSSSSSSSSRLAWPTEMLTAVLQTTIEAQVRSMQQPASTPAGSCIGSCTHVLF
jgi:hypothetical protein